MAQNSAVAHAKRLQNGLVENRGPISTITSLHGKDQQLESGVGDNWTCIREEIWRPLRKGPMESCNSHQSRGFKWYM